MRAIRILTIPYQHFRGEFIVDVVGLMQPLVTCLANLDMVLRLLCDLPISLLHSRGAGLSSGSNGLFGGPFLFLGCLALGRCL